MADFLQRLLLPRAQTSHARAESTEIGEGVSILYRFHPLRMMWLFLSGYTQSTLLHAAPQLVRSIPDIPELKYAIKKKKRQKNERLGRCNELNCCILISRVLFLLFWTNTNFVKANFDFRVSTYFSVHIYNYIFFLFDTNIHIYIIFI